MFGLGFIGGLAGGLISNLFNHHHHHHCHNHGGHGHHGHPGGAALDFALAQDDFQDARREFAKGDFADGFQQLSDGYEHLADAYSHSRWI